MRWTDESHPTVHRCPTPASFSTNGHFCRMKPISPARKLGVLRRAPYLSDSPANRSLSQPPQRQPSPYSFVLANFSTCVVVACALQHSFPGFVIGIENRDFLCLIP